MDPDRDLQNGRIARLELTVNELSYRVKLLSLATTTTATAVMILAAGIAIMVTSGK